MDPVIKILNFQGKGTEETGTSESTDLRNGTTNFDSEDDESDAACYSSSEDEKNDSESEHEFEWCDNEALDEPKRTVQRKSLVKNLPDHTMRT